LIANYQKQHFHAFCVLKKLSTGHDRDFARAVGLRLVIFDRHIIVVEPIKRLVEYLLTQQPFKVDVGRSGGKAGLREEGTENQSD
jgi:hypothetical protein